MNVFEPETSELDHAARAGWLAHFGGLTQDQIAAEMGVSRQRAQRLVARAMAEGLIHVRLEHRLSSCLRLEAELARRFALLEVRVAPGLGAGSDPARVTAAVAADVLERYLARPEPLVIAFGTGRSLSAMADEVAAQDASRHRVVSLIGNIAPDGSATFFDVILRIAARLRTPHYPMSVPVVMATPQERALFHALAPVQAVVRLAQSADVSFVGVGQMGDDAPLYKDGFVTREELAAMQTAGAAGEIAGSVYDSAGRYIETPLTHRMGGVRIEPGRAAPVVGVAAGLGKLAAIRAALAGRLLNGLVTDEPTAQALLG
ncbi:MAG: MarR family transcriptional regulator [Paracoccaceae bacterium]|nr:MAG: MarR family transcriptional regulator [Paracoccaceae bacterium]